MRKYLYAERYPVAVDCIIFGFDGREVKLLLIHRGFEPQKGKWSLMGGFVDEKEGLDEAASRVLKKLTGLDTVYMEQLMAFGESGRDPVERTISVAYFALIDIHKYENQLTDSNKPGWFPLNKIPKLIFDHRKMVDLAKERLRIKATHSPILFELLPARFTILQLQSLYESVFARKFDKRNFSRKLLAEQWIVRLKEKDKQSSRKGAFYFRLNKKLYEDRLREARFPA